MIRIKRLPATLFIALTSTTLVAITLICSQIQPTSEDIQFHSNQSSMSSPDDLSTQAKAINEQAFLRPIKSAIPQMPASLQGIKHGIRLSTDETGNLIISDQVKSLFEFYLSAFGETSFENILLLIQHDLHNQLEAQALQQALNLLRNYIDYKIDLEQLPEHQGQGISGARQLSEISEQKRILKSLREQYFDPDTYEAFFKAEDQYDQFMLKTLAISKDGSLSPQEKQEQLELAEHLLPDHIRDSRQRVSQFSRLFDQTETLKAEGATKRDIYHLRAQTLGDDAAIALEKLDEARLEWDRRLQSYKQFRDEIYASGLSEDDQKAAIQQLIDEQFAGTERVRVRALTPYL